MTFKLKSMMAMCLLAGSTFVAGGELKTDAQAWFWEDLRFSPAIVLGPTWHNANLLEAPYRGTATQKQATFGIVCDKTPNGTLSVKLEAVDEKTLVCNADFKLSSQDNVWHRYIDVGFSDKYAQEVQWEANGKLESMRFVKDLFGEAPPVKWLKLVFSNGTEYEIETNGSKLWMQDNRKWNVHGGFSVRISVADIPHLTFKLVRHDSKKTVVDLKPYVNRSVADETADDGQGGWTDQGSTNDLRRFRESHLEYENIPFEIVPKQGDDDRQVLVIGGSKRLGLRAESEVTLPANLDVRGFALLHSSAWTPKGPLGEIVVKYEDTGRQVIPVIGGEDIGNWWSDGDLSNAKITWKAEVGNVKQALYASCFELKGRKPVSISFHVTNQDAIWMIMGLTMLERPCQLPSYVPRPVTMQANETWRPIRFERRVTPGSPLDFSQLVITHKPAGKFGRVVHDGEGHFRLENKPGQLVRFNGVNLCEMAMFLEKKDSDELAVFLAAQGINSVRFHHHDNYLAKAGTPTSTVIDLDRLDRLEYLVAKLKEQGIYITFDVFTSRKLREGDNLAVFKRFPGFLKLGHSGAKIAFVTQDDAFENWKTFARNWLTHKNPYTNMTWLEDPVVVFANLSNEDTITASWFHTAGSAVHKLLSEAYAEYCAKHPERHLNPQPSSGNMDYMRVMVELQKKRNRDMAAYLKNELNAKFMLTSANFNGNLFTTCLRDSYDLVDDHMYHAHPQFPVNPWGMPMEFTQTSVIAGNAWLPTNMFKGRIYGKPFVMTEFNFCAPNIYRCEDGPLMGAYSALNDISGIYRFDFCCSETRLTGKKAGIILFESVHDPIMQFSDRISAALFVRGDVEPSPVKAAIILDGKALQDAVDMHYPPFDASGSIVQIGTMFKEHPLSGVQDAQSLKDTPAGKLQASYREKGVAESVTGQIRLFPEAKKMEIGTSRSAVVTLDKNARGEAGVMKVTQSDTFQTLAAISLDGKALPDSNSIVVLHSTDAVATGTRFADQDLRRQENNGTDPLLIRRGTALVSLKTNAPKTVTAIDFQGDALEVIPADYKNGILTFKADNTKGIAGYHLK